MSLYPLRFEPIYKEKVWGGRALEKLGRRLPGGEAIGESWELADLASTSAGGGGGEAEHSRVADGPLAGEPINQLIADFGKALMGRLPLSDQNGFPLLVKFLDARQNLSIQVHPSPAYAAEHPEAYLKSEAWYIVDAEPDAVIYKGVKAGVTAGQFREAIARNTVEDLVIAVPVAAGDIHYLPSGTCHALGAGIVVAEVQTPSDTTFRVYDWGREGRELHVDQALASMDLAPADSEQFQPHTRIERDQTLVEALVRCEHFHIDRVRMAGGYHQKLVDSQPIVWIVLEGKGQITCEHPDPDAAVTQVTAGQTYLIPPGITGGRIEVSQAMTLLEVQFPQAMADLLA